MDASRNSEPPHNKRMKLTGAAILVSRGTKVLQAAPAAYPYRSAGRSRAEKPARLSGAAIHFLGAVAMKHEISLGSGAKVVTEVTEHTDDEGTSEFVVQYVVGVDGVASTKTCYCTCGTSSKSKTCKNGTLGTCACGPGKNTVKTFTCS